MNNAQHSDAQQMDARGVTGDSVYTHEGEGVCTGMHCFRAYKMNTSDEVKFQRGKHRHRYMLGKHAIDHEDLIFRFEIRIPISGCLFSERGRFDARKILMKFEVECQSQEDLQWQAENKFPQTYEEWSESVLHENDARWSTTPVIRPHLRKWTEIRGPPTFKWTSSLQATIEVQISADDSIRPPKFDAKVRQLQEHWKAYLASCDERIPHQPVLLEWHTERSLPIEALIAYYNAHQSPYEVSVADVSQTSQPHRSSSFAHDVYVCDQYQRCNLKPKGTATQYVGQPWADKLRNASR
jgi:hypothetical protein